MKKLLYRINDLLITRKNLLTEAGKYFIVGGLCTVLDFALLYLLTKGSKMQPVPASVISFMAGTLLNYYLCTVWIFKVRAVTNRQLELGFYIAITSVGLVINLLLIWVCTSSFGYDVMVSKLMAAFATYWWNFGARKYFLHSSFSAQNS